MHRILPFYTTGNSTFIALLSAVMNAVCAAAFAFAVVAGAAFALQVVG